MKIVTYKILKYICIYMLINIHDLLETNRYICLCKCLNCFLSLPLQKENVNRDIWSNVLENIMSINNNCKQGTVWSLSKIRLESSGTGPCTSLVILIGLPLLNCVTFCSVTNLTFFFKPSPVFFWNHFLELFPNCYHFFPVWLPLPQTAPSWEVWSMPKISSS